LSAEFEALMGTKFKFSFILVTCALPKRKIASSKIDIREGYRGSRLGPLFFRDIVLPLESFAPLFI